MSGQKPRKRPCRVCGKWYLPNAHTWAWQKTCGTLGCRKTWEAKRQARWRQRNPDYEHDRYLRRQLDRAGDGADRVPGLRPPPPILAEVPWRLVQTVSGAKVAVLTAFWLRLLHRRTQTVSAARTRTKTRYPGRHLTFGDQTEMAARAGLPDDSS